MATTSLRNWNFQSFHVETDIEGGDFISAQSILLAAGPPKLRFLGGQLNTAAKAAAGLGQALGANNVVSQVASAAGTAVNVLDTQSQNVNDLSPVVYPIGVVEAVNVSQAKQLQRLFEIGSKRSYFIPGRNIGQASITRTIFNGPNLLRALYAYYPPEKINPSVKALLLNASQKLDVELPDITNQPGYGNYFINLDSKLFDLPFGLMLYKKTTCDEPYGAVYLETAHINSHQMSISATSTLLAEGVTIQFDQAIPVSIGANVQTGANFFNSAGTAVSTLADTFNTGG